MRLGKTLYLSIVAPLGLLSMITLNSCSKEESSSDSNNSATTNGYSLPLLSGPNVLTLTVNGSTCSNNSYINKPCIALQICPPGSTSGCQTITDILLDTGSFGLRIFKQAINTSLASTFTPITSSGQEVAECVQYGDGSKNWGPIRNANVILGEEPAVQVPIQVIDSTYSSSATYCNGADTSPTQAGFNGILGVGHFLQDCGSRCAQSASNGLYFACTGSSCAGTTVALTKQVQNPVGLLPTDNNGVIVELPLIPIGGATFVNGYLILGIGTQSTNIPTGVTSYSASASTGDFSTTFEGESITSFLDTGSNGLFFTSSMPDCSSSNANFAGWYCPNMTTYLSASNTGYSGAPTVTIPFQIGNIANLNFTNRVFLEVGGSAGGKIFDWGLPFFIGRNVYVGFSGRTSNLGTGPYWAY